ncbi:small, acid-soluble spore protein tlp [Anoxybacillus sp. B7M1]|jgi:small acid-soluble spore protein (thioredoxin-like protein)|uniref:Small acid-soluble spore protein Tlp n=1 Tax=Anoxybacteroides rupiense TaxID=311460 RepID=A0ABD5IT14_9BACL|nr:MULTISPECIES: small acid-soluble spore protein Tlp [Anoxybacillus]ANB56493.1 small, acid-soluble spore protein tlp [Anoxybacillus sp. B2M1]ANB65449.1 small, acid-soluble spore protein tlp [Anoxybacillus sp. B7M1]KXG09425.1 Small, acid-soluble spore protein Tlp [Anoxybacillus sp. P3H1B]MBB3907973.1 small acid-soluble spore protein (thioredoxin-like protein) [Anoxybacillus rupiensis]MBS2771779.1 small acid-soluble spore protein Tlp [Anoxybacillus rupiensis]
MAYQRPNPDDRSDNVEKLQNMVQNTIENIEEAHEAIPFSSSEERKQIEAKNKRREEAIAALRSEIKDEAAARQNGYQ